MTRAPACGVTADVAITKGTAPSGDRARLSFPDGTAHHAVVRVIGDLPHLVVESAFGLRAGLWGTLTTPTPTPPRPNGSIRLVSVPLLPGPPERSGPGYSVAKAAADAVVNRWGDGPDTPDGVRDRMRARGPEAADLADSLADETIRAAVAGVRCLYRLWRALPPGGTLHLTWPLHHDRSCPL